MSPQSKSNADVVGGGPQKGGASCLVRSKLLFCSVLVSLRVVHTRPSRASLGARCTNSMYVPTRLPKISLDQRPCRDGKNTDHGDFRIPSCRRNIDSARPENDKRLQNQRPVLQGFFAPIGIEGKKIGGSA